MAPTIDMHIVLLVHPIKHPSPVAPYSTAPPQISYPSYLAQDHPAHYASSPIRYFNTGLWHLTSL
ncbi:hypothetical protein CY34DRAFT_800676 [Suillus luteus UH-Slu-Lm8-n1]|uniref:Uncharacterized protein n=1 Tax=Suillus luteus UH-Slu-Lm8-n1 TaxID=930992 RepID=A0A0D0A7U0_9AGAM|nr:hypothetical protein CY34DRAFT_800676 [Suillus luteus UH-Slu-Lm8-n1]